MIYFLMSKVVNEGLFCCPQLNTSRQSRRHYWAIAPLATLDKMRSSAGGFALWGNKMTDAIEMIYFIKAETGAIKIGRSVDPSRRLANLQVGSPVALSIIAVMPGTKEDEIGLHKMFISDRYSGEWFRPSLELEKFIETLPKWKTAAPKQYHWRIEINKRKTKSGELLHWVYRFGSGENRQTVYGGAVKQWMVSP